MPKSSNFCLNISLTEGLLIPPKKIIYKKFSVSISTNHVRYILSNKAYIGEWYGISDYGAAIVSYDLFKRVQEILGTHRKYDPENNRIYLFSGLLQCPYCKQLLAGHSSGANMQGEYKNPVYRCSRYKQKIGWCEFSRGISEKKIETFLLLHLKNKIQELINNMNKKHKESNPDKLQTEIAKCKNQLKRLEDIYIEGELDKSSYIERRGKLIQKLSELTTEYQRIPHISELLRQIITDNNFVDKYNKMSREEKRTFWHQFVYRITFEDTPESRGPKGVFHFNIIFL